MTEANVERMTAKDARAAFYALWSDDKCTWCDRNLRTGEADPTLTECRSRHGWQCPSCDMYFLNSAELMLHELHSTEWDSAGAMAVAEAMIAAQETLDRVVSGTDLRNVETVFREMAQAGQVLGHDGDEVVGEYVKAFHKEYVARLSALAPLVEREGVPD